MVLNELSIGRNFQIEGAIKFTLKLKTVYLNKQKKNKQNKFSQILLIRISVSTNNSLLLRFAQNLYISEDTH